VRVPHPDRLPPGPLATTYLDAQLVTRGLITAADLYPAWDPDIPFEERKYAPALGEKLRMLFESAYPNVHGVVIQPVWAAGDLLQFECDFHAYISGRQLAKQEGLIFRHLLRLILLLGEFSQVVPPGIDPAQWRGDLRNLADRFTAACRAVDPNSTEFMLAHAADLDVVVREPSATTAVSVPPAAVAAGTGPLPAQSGEPVPGDAEPPPTFEEMTEDFGGGILDSE